MTASYAEQVMRDHGSITWEVLGESVRDTTDEERAELRAKRVEAEYARSLRDGVLDHHELPKMRFMKPKGTKYVVPHAAYDDMESPLAYRSCRWPRTA